MPKQLTVTVSPECKAELNRLKQHPRETYGDVIENLISKASSIKVREGVLGNPSLKEEPNDPSFEQAVEQTENTGLIKSTELETPKSN